MADLNRFLNRESIGYWKSESSGAPAAGDTSYGTAPTSPYYLTFADAPSTNEPNNIVPGYSAGHQTSNFDRYDQYTADITLPVRLSSIGLLSQCLMTSGGALPRTAIGLGPSNRNSNAGKQYLYRHCKCATWSLSATPGAEVMFTPVFYALGAPDVLSSGLLSPGLSDVTDSLAVETWTTMTGFEADGGGTAFNLRPYLTSLTLQGNNNLVREGTENYLGDDVVTSCRALTLLEGTFQGTGSFTVDANVNPSLIAAAAAAASARRGHDIEVVFEGSTVTLGGVNFSPMSQQGGALNTPLGYQFSFTYRTISAALNV